jgi:hypothetical protein
LKNFILRELSFLAAPLLVLSLKRVWSRIVALAVIVAAALFLGATMIKIVTMFVIKIDWADFVGLAILLGITVMLLFFSCIVCIGRELEK